MFSELRGHTDPDALPHLTLSAATSSGPLQIQTEEPTLEVCLLETQRQLYRLEEIVHRLTSVAGKGGEPAAGVMSLIQESNRRLRREVDEFTLDSHAVLRLVRPTGRTVRPTASVPPAN